MNEGLEDSPPQKIPVVRGDFSSIKKEIENIQSRETIGQENHVISV